MRNKKKILALFNYISEISKNLKNTKTNIAEEKWFDFLAIFLNIKTLSLGMKIQVKNILKMRKVGF